MENNPKQETEAPTEVTTRQTSNLRLRWEWAEASIWTDKMLTALENGVKGNKWFSLIDKVHKSKTLLVAWDKVRANKGAAGIDQVTIERFAAQEGKYLEELENAIKTEGYDPQAVKRVYIPKGQGKTRPLGIPCVIDRIAQQAVKLVIEPIMEKEFLDVSYGFRPKRGAKDALGEVDRLIKEGHTYVVDADLESYFDTISHSRLMDKLRRYISDGRLLKLVESWLKQGIMEECREWTPAQGTPQGGVLSPVLANLYLHDLDQYITEAGGKMIRYADDFVILCRSQEEATAMISKVREWVTMNELKLHPEKTHVGNCLIKGQGFEFLGYRFEAGDKTVRSKSTQKFRDKVKTLTGRSCGKAMKQIIRKLNPMLKGWYEYFKHVKHKYGLETQDAFVRRRLRAVLRKQEKRAGYGKTVNDHIKWPNAYFAKLGLFVMEDSRSRCVASQSR